MKYFALVLIASTCVAYICFKLKIPGGMLTGAILGSVAVRLLIQGGAMPVGFKAFSQIIAGSFIGCSLEKDDLKQLKKCTVPAGIMMLSLLLVNFVAGLVLWKIGLGDFLTCLLAVIPGGISDISLFATDVGADVSVVVILHFFRMLAGVGLFPLVIQKIAYKERNGEAPKIQLAERKKVNNNWLRIIAVLFASSTLGLTARRLGVPSGTLLFSIIGALMLKLMGFEVSFPRWLKRIAQIASGAYIGTLLTFNFAGNISILIFGIIVSIALFMINAYITGKVLQKTCNVQIDEGMLMLTPAGASDMVLISSDIGVMSSRLVVLQMFRLITVTSLFPYICLFASRLQ